MSGLILGPMAACASALVGCFASMGFAACRSAGGAATAVSARLSYTLLFMLAQVSSWLMRDYAKPLMEKLPWVVKAYMSAEKEKIPDAYFGTQAVLRLSMGNTLFFGLLSLGLMNCKTTADPRHKYLHKGSWAFKVFVWTVLAIVPFLIKSKAVVNVYAWMARLGSGVFLLLQMVILLDFAYMWSESWVAKDTTFWLRALLACTAAGYVGGITLLGMGFSWFKPPGAGACSLNVFVLVLAIFMGIGYSAAVLHPAVPHGSLLCSAIIFSYNAYLLVSGLSSQPDQPGSCNVSPFRTSSPSGAAGQAGAAGGMLLALASVAYSAVRAGSSKAFSLRDEEEEAVSEAVAEGAYAALQERPSAELAPGELPPMRADGSAPLPEQPMQDMPALPSRPPRESDGEEEREAAGAGVDVPYNYSFFHGIFALGSCYTAMLLTGWGSSSQGETVKDSIGVGWAAVWVKIACTWATSVLYTWTLVAPALFPDRFGHVEGDDEEGFGLL